MKKSMFFAVCLTIVSVQSLACSCAELNFERHYDLAGMVFKGVPYRSELKGMRLRTYFNVKQIYKGRVDKVVMIYTSRDSAACGLQFSLGAEYIVYASAEGKTSLCNGSRRNEASYANHKEELEYLQKQYIKSKSTGR